MAYFPFNLTKPDPTESSDGMGDMQDHIRKNLNALRDSFIGATGFFFGWDAELQDNDGGTPPTDPALPEQVVYSRTYDSTTYQIRQRYTYYTSGVTEDLVETIITHFKVGAGAWELVADTDFPLGTCTVTYDANGLYLSHAWT